MHRWYVVLRYTAFSRYHDTLCQALWAMGVELVLIFGIITFALNFIPNIGQTSLIATAAAQSVVCVRLRFALRRVPLPMRLSCKNGRTAVLQRVTLWAVPIRPSFCVSNLAY